VAGVCYDFFAIREPSLNTMKSAPLTSAARSIYPLLTPTLKVSDRSCFL
jgi:hypothetical protein